MKGIIKGGKEDMEKVTMQVIIMGGMMDIRKDIMQDIAMDMRKPWMIC